MSLSSENSSMVPSERKLPTHPLKRLKKNGSIRVEYSTKLGAALVGEDALLANDTFERLMGDDVEPRRLFIEENAKFVSNLDI